MEMDLDTLNFSELRDVEIVARMRKINYEKFKTLVRMHLSFELDLNTDEFDLPCHEIVYEDKGKVKKWNRLSKKHKHGAVVAALASGSAGCASGATAKGCGGSSGGGVTGHCGGSPPESLHQTIDPGFLFHLQELKEFLLLPKNTQQEGIFRKTGSSSRQNDLRAQIQNDKLLELEVSGYSAHDCATVFKGYLSELPEPLLTDAHYPAHLQIAPLCLAVNAQLDAAAASGNLTTQEEKAYSISSSSSVMGERLKRELHVLNSIQLLLLLLPDENRQLLQHIIEMLHAVALQQDHNKMGPDNLATLFAPHLICPRNLPPEALHYLARKMSSIVSYMIVRGQDIFAVPAKLATDIRAYFLERKRKKTMSPEMTLDESISDISTVNTVYTFVDREKTAAVTTTNTTDTELAQLYAHIQSMPESSKKRRLIKQFNKQNGQGTPLQLQALNRVKNADTNRGGKSLSDSIKKHIFHKGIMSRTPKRQPIPSIVLETPNNSSMKHHKQRVLFQSPNPQTISTSATDVTTTLSSSSASTSSTSSLSSMTNSIASTNNHTPYIIKSHPLQKSISSSSLLMNHHHQQTLPNNHRQDSSNSSLASNPSTHGNSSDGFACQTKSISAPVSRQTSSDLKHHINTNTSITSTTSTTSSMTATTRYPLNHLDVNCCVTPLKLISEAAKHLMQGGVEKKSVAWDDSHLIDSDYLANPSTPLQQQTPSNDLKSRYKSEPNLSLVHNICETPSSSTSCAHDMRTPITKLMPGKSITRKLMKGVSMGNLKFPFSTPDTTKRLVRSVSSTLKRRGSDDLHLYHQAEGSLAAAIKSGNAPLLHDMDEDDDLDDDTFEDYLADDCGGGGDGGGCVSDAEIDNRNHGVYFESKAVGVAGCSGSSSSELPNFTGGAAAYQQLLLQQSGIYRNMDLVTSTPSLLLGRRSMSPITKSTQRMPKAMQESIMTPRSRKPVMVLTTTTVSSCTDHNQTINAAEISGGDNNELEEDDDDDDVEDEGNEEDEEYAGDNFATTPLAQAKSHPPQTEVINEDATSFGSYSDIFKRRQLLQANHSFVRQLKIANGLCSEGEDSISNGSKTDDEEQESQGKQERQKVAATDELSANFKEYLLTRSGAPVDTSFSSHSDDYESSREMDDIDENQLSSSLLYCLDGNRPESNDGVECNDDAQQNEETSNVSKEEDTDTPNTNDKDIKANTTNIKYDVTTTAVSSTHLPFVAIPNVTTTSNRLSTNPFVILNNARKRAATNDLEKMSSLLFNSQNSPSCRQDGFKTYDTTLLKSHKMITNNKNSLSTSSNAAVMSSNKENCTQHDGSYVANKKLLISEQRVEEYPGETSF